MLPDANNDEASDLVALRRHLHTHPELRFREQHTSDVLAERLGSICDELVTGVAGTGLVARMHGSARGPHVLLRADMDAYPVTDGKPVSYASRNPGVSHACGHDVHMTVAVGVLERLSEATPPSGSLTVLFQPAEETPFGELSGAQAVIDSGALGRSTFDAVLGLHCWPDLDIGQIGVDADIAMAAKDAFRLALIGKGAHAATPSRGRDAILGMSVLISSLHAAIARRHEQSEKLAFNVGTVLGGKSQSQIPDIAECTGSLRTHDSAVRDRLKAVLETVSEHTASAFDLDLSLTWANEMPAVQNDAKLVELVRQMPSSVVRVTDLRDPPLTTDDFALLTSLGPSLYLKLGVRGEGGLGSEPLHSPRFDVDERCIAFGVGAFEHLVRALLAVEDTGARL